MFLIILITAALIPVETIKYIIMPLQPYVQQNYDYFLLHLLYFITAYYEKEVVIDPENMLKHVFKWHFS